MLSVPTAGMEGVVLAIGGCSGRDGYGRAIIYIFNVESLILIKYAVV